MDAGCECAPWLTLATAGLLYFNVIIIFLIILASMLVNVCGVAHSCSV